MTDRLPAPKTPDPLPWERQPKEPARAFSYFSAYRDGTGTRSIAKVAKNHGKSIATLNEMSQKWGWVERAGAYDDYLDRLRRDAWETELVRAERQMGAMGRQAAALGGARLFGREASVREDGTLVEEIPAINPAELDAVAAITLAERGWRMFRTATGQPTDILKGMHSISAADLLRVAEAMYEIAQRLWGADPLFARYASEVQLFIDTGRLPWQER